MSKILLKFANSVDPDQTMPSVASDIAPDRVYFFNQKVMIFFLLITKTCLYNFDPLEPHFYIVKLGFTGVYIIFLISDQKHRLWVLVRTALSRQF